jgi:hypothetical protein
MFARAIHAGGLSAFARLIGVILCPVLVSGCIVWWPLLPSRPAASPRAATPSGPISSEQATPFPDLPLADLKNAPAVAIWSPEPGDRIRVSIWRSGTVTDALVVPRLNSDPTSLDHIRVSVSPSAHFVVVTEISARNSPTSFVRIFSMAGNLIWTGPPYVQAIPRTRWSPDETHLAIDAGGRWIVVSPTATAPAASVEIDARGARQAINQVAYAWGLIDFSEDGRTLYGEVGLGVDRFARPHARASVSGGPIEPLGAFPTVPGRRLAYPSNLNDRPFDVVFDPVTGRTAALACPNLSCQIEIRDKGKVRSSGPAHTFLSPVGLAWQHDSVMIVHDEDLSGSLLQHVGLVPVGPTLGNERRVASFAVVGRHACMVAVTNGFVLLGFGRGLPETRNRLLMVRLNDGRATVLDSDGTLSTPEFFGFAGWVRSSKTTSG